MKVVKRDKREEAVNLQKVLVRIRKLAKGLSKKIVPEKIATETINGLYDGITTIEIDTLASETAASYTNEHPDYSILASKICISRLHKETDSDFRIITTKLHEMGRLNDEYFNSITPDMYKKINNKLDFEKDYTYDYFGFKTLEKSYLLKKDDGRLIERPQHMLMRIALTVTNTLEEAFEYYETASNKKISPATPIQFNSGAKRQQLASCVLISNKGDSLDGLTDTYKDVARTSADAAGIGICLDNIRSKHSTISTTGGAAAGVLKQLKVYNELAKTYNQSGKRNGSFAPYISIFHKDIEDVIEIKKNTGKEELRARELFPALIIPDLFMERVKADEDFTLFCPHDFVKHGEEPLYKYHGEEFRQKYEEAENDPKYNGVKISARKLWTKVCETQVETGLPYILYKDNVNAKSNHTKAYGTVTQSNLCIEIMQYTDPETTAICTLTSLPLNNFINKGKFDFEDLGKSTKIAVNSLNVVIGKNKYSTKEGKKGGLEQRAIGIGVQGLADTFAILGMDFESDEAKKLNKEIFECIYYYSLKASCEYAKKHGVIYKDHDKSYFAEGKLQFHLWGLNEDELSGMFDWKSLIADIKKYGLANSQLTALMPTASTAQILGNNECFEPFTSNMYVRRVISGEFNVVNKHLVKDLEKLDLWDDEMVKAIILNSGKVYSFSDDLDERYREFVQSYINSIPDEIRSRYKTVYEMKQSNIIDMAADRGVFIDQSQSMNIFVETPNVAKINKIHFYAWKKGLKTGMYYLRSKSASSSQKSIGIDVSNLQIKANSEDALACSLDNPEACQACGS